MVFVQAVKHGVFAQAWEVFNILALQLDAQHIGYIAPVKGFYQVMLYLNT
jgi:hypothetical protein